MIRVPVLLLLLLLLMGCSEKVRVQTRLIHEPIPESLADETPTPVLKTPATWGGIAIWADQLHDALDTCNADKSDIRALNLLRLARQKGAEQHAEN